MISYNNKKIVIFLTCVFYKRHPILLMTFLQVSLKTENQKDAFWAQNQTFEKKIFCLKIPLIKLGVSCRELMLLLYSMQQKKIATYQVGICSRRRMRGCNSISDWVALGLLFGPSRIIHLDQNLAITIFYTEILMRKIDQQCFFTSENSEKMYKSTLMKSQFQCRI